jgi:hypothetical protein
VMASSKDLGSRDMAACRNRDGTCHFQHFN